MKLCSERISPTDKVLNTMTRIAAPIDLTIYIFFYMMSANVMAESQKNGLASIEAQERTQIISELSYKLDTKQVCEQTLVWSDAGSGADLDGYFFIPADTKLKYIIGGHASHKGRSKSHCVTTVRESSSNGKKTPPLLVKPKDWKRVWKDSGSGATKDGSFWQAISPDNNYRCIGSISQLGHNKKPNLPNYRCVHKSLTDKVVANRIVWSDKGTGADQQVTIFGLATTGTFIAVPSREKNTNTYDLKKNASSDPDPKMVEKILAERIAPLKEDIEAKSKTIQEQKVAAKKVEQKKKSELAEKKKQEKVAEKKSLAVQAEVEKEDNAEAERLKKQQQVRIEKVVAEKEKQAQKNKINNAHVHKDQTNKEEAKSEPELEVMAEEVAQTEPEEMQPIETSSNGSSVSEVGEESKGLSDILMFFVKVFGMMVGGVIVLIVAFKLLFGKKEK